MRQSSKLSRFFFWGLIFLSDCSSTPPVASKNIKLVTILHTNDVHGHAWPFRGKETIEHGGFAAQAHLIQKVRDEVSAKGGVTVTLSAGDANTGVPESDQLFGEPDILAMNLVGYDAMVLGNHEFDHGISRINLQRTWATFPFLSANILQKNNEPLVDPLIILERQGIKIGIFGLTTGDLPKLIVPHHTREFNVKDPLVAAQESVSFLREKGADIIIALTHLGIRGNRRDTVTTQGRDDKELTENVNGLSLVVGGHSHVALQEGIRHEGVLIVQAGEKGEYVGRVDLEWDSESRKVVSSRASLIPVIPSDGENQEIRVLLATFQARADKMLSKEVGESLVDLNGERQSVRHSETNLGNFICDVIRVQTNSRIAIFNGGGIRSSIPKGKIRMRDIFRVLPFRNTVVTAEISGRQLREALENGLKNQNSTGSFLQVSGLKYKARGTEVVSLTVSGIPVRPQDILTLVTNNFLAQGGDNFDILTQLKVIKDTHIPVEEMILRYLKKHPKIAPKDEGRIHLLENAGS